MRAERRGREGLFCSVFVTVIRRFGEDNSHTKVSRHGRARVCMCVRAARRPGGGGGGGVKRHGR